MVTEQEAWDVIGKIANLVSLGTLLKIIFKLIKKLLDKLLKAGKHTRK